MDDIAGRLEGRFLVVDGPDGAGKSTQLRLRAEYLRAQDLEVQEVRDPGGTAIGDRIRTILLDPACNEMSVPCELMLYMASRAQLAAEIIRPALSRGACVLSDRYVSSTVAYQGAGGASIEDVVAAAEIATGGLWPDLTLLLDLDAEVGLARAGNRGDLDRMEAKDLDFHRRVRELFLAQAYRNPARFAVIDANVEPEEVARRIRGALMSIELS